jgi:ribosomal protein S20
LVKNTNQRESSQRNIQKDQKQAQYPYSHHVGNQIYRTAIKNVIKKSISIISAGSSGVAERLVNCEFFHSLLLHFERKAFNMRWLMTKLLILVAARVSIM